MNLDILNRIKVNLRPRHQFFLGRELFRSHRPFARGFFAVKTLAHLRDIWAVRNSGPHPAGTGRDGRPWRSKSTLALEAAHHRD